MSTLANVITTLSVVATLIGIYVGWRSIQANRRRVQVRLQPLTETVTIVAVNPGDKDVPLASVQLRTAANQVLPLDALTEGHFPLNLPAGASYKLPINRGSLVQVMERNGLATSTKLRAEFLDATGKARASPATAID